MAYGVVVSDAILTLRQWLLSSDFKPGARIPSERQLALQFGLKHNAINRAMIRLISEGLVKREGYKLYYAAEKTDAVAFTCDLVLARRSILLRGYRKVAKELGVDLRLHYYESVDEAVGHLHRLDTPGTESVLFDPPHGPPAMWWAPAMRQLLAHGIPSISIRQYAENIPCVLADQARAVDLVFSHLRELGHTEMALFTIAPRASVSIEIHKSWQSLPWGKNGKASARRIAFYDDAREDVQTLAQKLAGEWKNVTALVVYTVHEPVVPHLLEELARLKRYVPKDLSLIGLGDLPHLTTSNPPVSTAAFDTQLVHETVFRLAQRLTRKKQSTGLLPPSPCLSIHPYLLLRESTQPADGFVPKKKNPGARSDVPLLPDHGLAPADFKQELRALLRRPYALTMTAESSRFSPVDLTAFVNRPLNYRKGWMGDLPLTHFGSGKHVIQGVPFQVLGGPARTDHGAIIFRSRTNETGNSRGLPSRLKIPIATKAAAIYILHGCGYTRFLSRFASYDFYAGTKKLGSVPIVALGQPPHDWEAAEFERNSQKANIQDWWGDYPHVDFPCARQVPIVPPDEDNTTYRYAYLYTLEWKNPFPNLTVSHMEITVDASQSTTLGLIAMTSLKKEGG
jgi:DNA-binding LacI/PurR family transcriptional regulator